MDDSISRAFVLSGLDALRPVKPKGPESVMETVNRSAWDCALNCAEAVVRTAPPMPEIVRCKDCKKNPHWEWVGCPMTGKGTRKPDDFCSYAERREDVRNP